MASSWSEQTRYERGSFDGRISIVAGTARGDPLRDLEDAQVLEAGVVDAGEPALEREEIQVDEIVDVDVRPDLARRRTRSSRPWSAPASSAG